MRFYTKRFLEEFFLYSSQFVVFFILMLFLSPGADELGLTAILIVTGLLLIQILLLVGQGHRPILRFLFSFITPAGYALVRVLGGVFEPYDMANVFLWAAALYVGLFQAIAIAARGRWAKRLAETLLALGAVLVFVFFYFYLDLRLMLARELERGAIELETYKAALDVRRFAPAFTRFIESPQHAFFAFGAATFGFMLLANKVGAISLRARIAALFGEQRLQGPVPDTEYAQAAEANVTVVSADVLNFSSLAERVPPGRAVDILNRYYSLWAVMAERHRGRIAGISGDSVLIVFGLMGEKDAAERALACALGFQAELPGLRADLAAASLPAFDAVSIGIHAGPIIAGDLGLPGQRRLGVFGDAISVASRLDSLCREFKQDLLLSQPVFRQLGLESQAKLLRIGEVLLRNSTQPVPVYGIK